MLTVKKFILCQIKKFYFKDLQKTRFFPQMAHLKYWYKIFQNNATINEHPQAILFINFFPPSSLT